MTPPSLNWDEISHGYNAYSIANTGRDEWGVFLPNIFRAYGDYKLPVYIYLTIPPILIFGLNEFSIRFISTLAGCLIILFTYLLTSELLKDHKPKSKTKWDSKTIPLISTFLVAIEPWTFFISRGAFEANLALFFIVSGTYYFLFGIKKPRNLIISSILFGLSIWTYNSARVFLPIFLPAVLFLYRKEIQNIWQKNKSSIAYSLLIISLFFLPMFYQLVNQDGQARFSKVTILDQGAIDRIIANREANNWNPSIERVVFNRYTYFVYQTGTNFILHLNPKFLYLKGGTNYQFSVPENGVLYISGVLFFVVGLLSSLIKRDRVSVFILGWFFIGFLASSITREAPHVLRSITTLPMPMVITAIGFSQIISILEKMKFPRTEIARNAFYSGLLLLPYIVAVPTYMIAYFDIYRTDFSLAWQHGYKEVTSYIKDKYNDYDVIIITKKYGEPHEFLLFYGVSQNAPWKTADFSHTLNLVRYEQTDWFWVDRMDKFYFINDWQVRDREVQNEFITERKETIDCDDKKCLLVTTPNNAPQSWKKVHDVQFLDGSIAFELYEN